MFWLNENEPPYLAFFRLIEERGKVQLSAGDLRVEVPAGVASVDTLLQAITGDTSPEPGTNWIVSGITAFDLVGTLVESYELGELTVGTQLRSLYFECCRQMRTAQNVEQQSILVQCIDEQAVIPHKSRPSDSGYDLTLIAERSRFGEVVLYGTGLIVQAPIGFYFDVVARSSIIKTGYMLANNVGIIDRAYRGELMVPLIKIDKNAPDLKLPVRLAQLIPRSIEHFSVQRVGQLGHTLRGVGGFGSTGTNRKEA
jgi:deoxyuridine 5'-triphosphate nucleotidohydrolase